MVYKRLQNRIAESRFTLPLTALLCVVACAIYGVWQRQLWIQFACLSLSTYMMVLLNNRNALIRIYSRMVSCSFLMLSITAIFLLSSFKFSILQLCFIGFYLFFFLSYQDRSASVKVFYAFCCMGVASTQFIQVLFFVPILWILMILNIMSFSLRNLCASLLGLVAPYWFIGSYCVYDGSLDKFIQHFTDIAVFSPLFQYEQIPLSHWLAFLYVVLVAVIGAFHFINTSYADKIRTRMLYETFITIDICALVFMILQPQHYDYLLCIMIINSAPLIGHYIALTHTWFTNLVFMVLSLGAIALTAFQLWISS